MVFETHIFIEPFLRTLSTAVGGRNVHRSKFTDQSECTETYYQHWSVCLPLLLSRHLGTNPFHGAGWHKAEGRGEDSLFAQLFYFILFFYLWFYGHI